MGIPLHGVEWVHGETTSREAMTIRKKSEANKNGGVEEGFFNFKFRF